MTRRYISVLLMSMLVSVFYGCQKEEPAQHTEVAPASSAPAAASPAQPVVQPPAAAPEAKAGAADANADGRALAQKSGCFACHAIDKKLVGPAWNDVAAKYRGQRDAETKLIAKVSKGGSGVWGSVPMPPNSPRVGDDDIKSLVRFILSLK